MNMISGEYKISRTALTRIFGLFVLFIYINTNSYWIVNYSFLSRIIYILGIILLISAAYGRIWCAVYISGVKDHILVTSGPYSLCRNPLYFFSLIGVIGAGLATRTLFLLFLFTSSYCFYYSKVIKNEENRLSEIFGSEYAEYCSKIPCFLPRFINFTEPENKHLNPICFRYDLSSALWFVLVLAVIETVNILTVSGVIKAVYILF